MNAAARQGKPPPSPLRPPGSPVKATLATAGQVYALPGIY